MYYDIYDGTEPEYELYDLNADPYESVNLAFPSVFASLDTRTQERVAAERQRLHTKLTEAMEHLGTTPDMIVGRRSPASRRPPPPIFRAIARMRKSKARPRADPRRK